MLIYSMLKFQPGPWLQRCMSLCARVVWCYADRSQVKLLCSLWVLASMVGCWSQPRWDASRASLLQHIWWKCLPDLPAYWFWWFLPHHCINRCLSSMCFAFFDDSILVAMLLPLDESVWILMLTFFLLSASVRELRMCSASAPVLMA